MTHTLSYFIQKTQMINPSLLCSYQPTTNWPIYHYMLLLVVSMQHLDMKTDNNGTGQTFMNQVCSIKHTSSGFNESMRLAKIILINVTLITYQVMGGGFY